MEKPLSVNLSLLSAVFTFHFNGDRGAQVLSAMDKSNPEASDCQFHVLNLRNKNLNVHLNFSYKLQLVFNIRLI